MPCRSLPAAAAVIVLAAGAGCGPPVPLANYLGLRLEPRTQPSGIQVLRSTTPDRPYQELGTIQISCPTEAERGFFGTVSIEGGCSYLKAIALASDRAAGVGADGIFNVGTSVAGNGNIVSLIATAFRYSVDAAELRSTEASPRSTDPPGQALPLVAERLRYLKTFLDKGLISQDEYDRRRADLLKEL